MADIALSSAGVEEVVESGILERLDADLLSRYPGEPVNGVVPEEFRAADGYFVVLRDGDEILACGAFRPYGAKTVEIKRMYVPPELRGRKIARSMLAKLEAEARRRGFTRSVLETAKRMPEAVALYASSGYRETGKYEPFVESERSVCFAKRL